MIKICHWVITKRCNLKCIHCIASTGSKRELNTKKALEVLNSLYNLGCKKLYITGGEPLIRTDIFEIFSDLILKVFDFIKPTECFPKVIKKNTEQKARKKLTNFLSKTPPTYFFFLYKQEFQNQKCQKLLLYSMIFHVF